MKASENQFPSVTLEEVASDGSDLTNPAADHRRLFLGEDGALHLRDSAGTVTDIGGGDVATDAIWDAKGDLAVGTAANTAQRLAKGTDGYVLTANSGTTTGLEWAAGGTSAADDPVADIFGAADTAYEFDTSSLTGLTAMGSPTAEDADTTIPGHLYLSKVATGTVALAGRYAATPATPFTAITKLSDHTHLGVNYQRVGSLFVGEATPGVLESICLVHNGDWKIAHYKYTNPTTYNSVIGAELGVFFGSCPIYYAVVVNSTSDFDFWWSMGGRVWRKHTDARNPSITIGSVGIFVDPENGSYGVAGAYDYLRIWESALTFPGVV